MKVTAGDRVLSRPIQGCIWLPAHWVGFSQELVLGSAPLKMLAYWIPGHT